MNILVGCEFSGIVREAFRKRGHNAWSCDLLPAADGSPHHLQGDIAQYVVGGGGWDRLIVFPPCTFLCGSGIHWNNRGRGWEETDKALAFVRWLLALPIPEIGLENPVGLIGTRITPATQYIHPYQFGHDASKKTGLWLRNLPPLIADPRNYVAPRVVLDPKTGKMVSRWGNQTDSGQNRLPPSEDRWALRSETYPGIANAMAEQWG